MEYGMAHGKGHSYRITGLDMRLLPPFALIGVRLPLPLVLTLDFRNNPEDDDDEPVAA